MRSCLVETLDGEEGGDNRFLLLVNRTNEVAFCAELIIGGDFLVVAAVGVARKTVDINCYTVTDSLSNRSSGGRVGGHVHTCSHAGTLLGEEEVSDILFSDW